MSEQYSHSPDGDNEEQVIQLSLGDIADQADKAQIEQDTVYGFEPVVDPSVGKP